MEKLKFLETVTVNEFKAQKGVNKIEIKQNPHTGKCFFVYGCETGAVSDKFLNGEVTILLSLKYVHQIQVTCSICCTKEVKVEL